MIHRASQLIPIAKITFGSDRLRRKVKKSEIERMKESIVANKQLQTILVRAVGDHFETIYGALRVLGAKEAGETLIWAEIADRELTAADVIKLQFCENEHRVPLNPIESAFGVFRFIEEAKISQTETAVELGLTDTEVSLCLERINDWSEELRQAVQEGKIPKSTGHEIHKIKPVELQPEAIRRASAGELTRDDVVKIRKRKRLTPIPLEGSTSQPSDAPALATPVATPHRVGRKSKAAVGGGRVWVSRDLSPSRVSAMLSALASRAQQLCAEGVVDPDAFFEGLREVSLEPSLV